MSTEPVRIVVSGIGRERMLKVLQEQGGGRVAISVHSDIEAVNAVKTGSADYYLGACMSGAGGALAIATALLGPRVAVRVSGLGTAPDAARIRAEVKSGARAFGMAAAHIEVVVPMILDAILDRASGG